MSPHVGSQIANHIKECVTEFLILDSKTQHVNWKKKDTRVISKWEFLNKKNFLLAEEGNRNWMEEARGRIQYFKTSPKITSEPDQIALQWQHRSHSQQSNVSSPECNQWHRYWGPAVMAMPVSPGQEGAELRAAPHSESTWLPQHWVQQQLLCSTSSASSALLWTQTYRWQEPKIKTIQASRSKVMKMPNCTKG